MADPENTLVVEPRRHLRTPPNPCVPITIRSVRRLAAASRITSARPYVDIHIGGVGDFLRPCFGELPKSRVGLTVNEVKVESQFGRFSQEGSTAFTNVRRPPVRRTTTFAHRRAWPDCSEKSTGQTSE